MADEIRRPEDWAHLPVPVMRLAFMNVAIFGLSVGLFIGGAVSGDEGLRTAGVAAFLLIFVFGYFIRRYERRFVGENPAPETARAGSAFHVGMIAVSVLVLLPVFATLGALIGLVTALMHDQSPTTPILQGAAGGAGLVVAALVYDAVCRLWAGRRKS